MADENKIVRQPVGERFPFGIDFQKSLLRLLIEDVNFCIAVMPYLEASFFENQVLTWAYTYLQTHKERYNVIPNMKVLYEEAKGIAVESREVYRITLDSVASADLSMDDWIKAQVLDFVKRNIFVRGFIESRDKFNAGKVDKAYDIMMLAMDKINNTDWEPPDRSFFFEEFDQRVAQRLSADPWLNSIPTGFPELDRVLNGGLSKGELGIWLAYSKRGKSTMLVNLGAQAVRRSESLVLHFVLEGSRGQVETRYDALFARDNYQRVKAAQFDKEDWERIQYEYQMYRRRLVIRGFTSDWNYSCANIWDEIRELKRHYDWHPDMLLVDYLDILRSREKYHKSETEHQTAACKDLKSIANRGYRTWTATQAQRPKKDIDIDDSVLQARNIGDAWGKVKPADFLGSINQTKEEREQKIARLFAELYRDNAAGFLFKVHADFTRMAIEPLVDEGEQAKSVNQPILGYTATGQGRLSL